MHFDYPNTKQIKEWCVARGMEVVTESETDLVMRLNSPCPHLKESKCDLHGCNKPKGCVDYPNFKIMESTYSERNINPLDTLGPKCGFRKK